MKRLMSITAVLAAVTCHSAYGQLDGIEGAAQSAAKQAGLAADAAASQVQLQASGNFQTGATANVQADRGAHQSGYRGNSSGQNQHGQFAPGQMQMTAHTRPVYLLRYDHTGREYICVQGRRIYFDDQPPMVKDQRSDDFYESSRQNLDTTDSEDQRPPGATQSDSDNGKAATEPLPATSPDAPNSSANTTDAESSSDKDENNDGEESQQSDDDSENKPDSDNDEGDANESDEA